MTTPRVASLALGAALAALALLACAGPAAGGGYSTTTLDRLDGVPTAGAPVEVGYTVRMHGVTPVSVSGSGIAVTGPDGRRTVFPGRPQGPPGHHVADVRFPRAGTWSWEYVIGAGAAQDLGSVEVAPAAGAAPAARSGGPGAAGWSLLAATVAAAVLLAAVALWPRRAAPAGP